MCTVGMGIQDEQAPVADAVTSVPCVPLVIGGIAVAGELGTYPVVNPARPAEVVLRAPSASSAQLDAAVSAARRSQPTWAGRTLEERAAVVERACDQASVAIDFETLSALLTREHGKTAVESLFDLSAALAMTSALAPLMAAAMAPEPAGTSIVERVPHGVVAAVLPFNWPAAVMGNKVLPALLAGNTVVVKTPPTCPGAVLEVVRRLAAGLPEGVLSAVNGPGPSLGAALVSHPGVDMVSFTGGVATGRAVLAACAPRLRPAVLELGGNDPAIVAPDVEPDEDLARRLLDAAFTTSGQVCMAVKRVYVPHGSLDRWRDALAAALADTVVGDGLDPEVTMGPVHTEASRDRVETLIAGAEAAGGQVVRPATVAGGPTGWFVPPALVVGPDPGCDLVVDEQFGPALPLLGYRDLDEAVAQANDTRFGLCASIWSGDDELADTVAARLNAGTVWTNAHGMGAMDHLAPMGGWGDSGLGLELGIEGMAAFTRPRTMRKGAR
jgi:acyl-CoA reductase-like NAD-dependent aldehyde dehydrogenase